MTGNIYEDIMKLLRHAACRSVYQTQEVDKLVNYLNEIQRELGMGESDNLVDRLRSLRQYEVRFQLLQEQQKMMNITITRM